MSVSGLPFDDIRDLISGLPPFDERAGGLARERSEDLNRAFGFGGHEAALCEWLAGWSGKSPMVSRPLIALFAGTHGIVANGENVTGQTTLASVTQMAAGGAPVNQVCATNDTGLKVFDLALQFPVDDITRGDALDEKGSAATIGFGMEAIAGGVDLLGLAAFGQGSEVSNIAMLSLLNDNAPEVYLPYFSDGAGETLLKRARQAIALHKTAAGEPLELLRRLGGREHSALLGAILAARVNHVPVVLDGLTAVCVAGLLNAIRRDATQHCLFAGEGMFTGQDGNRCILPGFTQSSDGTTAGYAISLLKAVASTHSNTVLDEA